MIPSNFAVNTNGNKLVCVISELKDKYKIENPIKSDLLMPTSSGDDLGNVKTVVMWNETAWRTKIAKPNPSFVQLRFPRRYLYPTAVYILF